MSNVTEAILLLNKISDTRRNILTYYTIGKFVRMGDEKSAAELLQYLYNGKTKDEIEKIYRNDYGSGPLQLQDNRCINFINTQHNKYDIKEFQQDPPRFRLFIPDGRYDYHLLISDFIYFEFKPVIELAKDDPINMCIYTIVRMLNDRNSDYIITYILNNYYNRFLEDEKGYGYTPIKLLNNGLKYTSTSFIPYYNKIIKTINSYRNIISELFLKDLTDIIIDYFNYPDI